MFVLWLDLLCRVVVWFVLRCFTCCVLRLSFVSVCLVLYCFALLVLVCHGFIIVFWLRGFGKPGPKHTIRQATRRDPREPAPGDSAGACDIARVLKT